MRKVAETLWVGNAFDVRDMRSVLNDGIKAVVDLAIDEPPITPTRELISLRIPLIDGSGNSDESLRLAISATRLLLASKIPTLIACSAGMSRSPLIAAAALSFLSEATLSAELDRIIAAGPCDISAPLLSDVRRIVDGL